MKTIQVAHNIWRGPSPKTEEDWNQLQKLGIKYTLDLQTGAALMEDGSPLNEAITAENYGIRTYAHPLGEILPPTKRELMDARWFISNFYPVYVHCKAGVDRTGMVIANYLLSRGIPRTVAIKNMKDIGMHWWYYWWAWFL